MKINVKNIKPLPSAIQLNEIQQAIGFHLPDTYLDVLKNLNGGEPSANIFHFSTGVDSGLDMFVDALNIPKEYIISEFNLLGKIFPIAHTVFGNKICISAEPEDYGSVYFWDHEIVDERSDLIFLAFSISEFMEMLEPFDESSVMLESDQVIKGWIDPDFLALLKEKNKH